MPFGLKNVGSTYQRAMTTIFYDMMHTFMEDGLKNAGSTYQRAMTTIFYDMMHTFMEDYVDDLLVESYTREEHLEILDNIFTRLEKFNVKLNPKKCAFGVTSTKLLGYIVL
jgi:hypothetical protein